MIHSKDFPRLTKMLTRHEGVSLKWYQDSLGFWTIGIGHLATKADDITKDWTMEEVQEHFYEDLQIAMKWVEKNFPWTLELDSCRHCALADMAFNLGPKLKGFKKLLKALEGKDWQEAHDQALNSLWAEQVKGRAKELAEMFKTGNWGQ